MKIVNPNADCHIHSLNFSDGMCTVDEIVQMTGKIGLEKIAITDHSQAILNAYGYVKHPGRSLIKRWKNYYNGVEVVFGVEGDILSESGDICQDIGGMISDFLVLSMHIPKKRKVYLGRPETVTEAYLRAIKRYHAVIKVLGHPCSKDLIHLDISAVTQAANEYKIPLEFNAANLENQKTDLKKLDYMLKHADQVMVNSDAHVMWEFVNSRKKAFDYLREKGYIS